MRCGRTAKEDLEKIINSTCVSLDTKPKITHNLACAVTTYRCENWPVEKADKKIYIDHLRHGVGGELYRYPGPTGR